MNVLRKQWSVSGQTVAVVQLSGSDEMGRVERGVPSSRSGHQSCLLYAPAPLFVEEALAYSWKPVELSKYSGLASARPLALRTARAALFCALCNLYNSELQ